MNVKRLDHSWPQLPRAELRARQAKQLQQYLRTVVLPFSPHYRELFQQLNLTAESIRTLDDLRRLPFTSKADLLPTPESPQRFKDFILAPAREALARRPATMLRAVLHGREHVARELAAEFCPVTICFTTGRATEPLAFVFTKQDIANIESASYRLMEICGAQPEYRMINAFPYAPHLAFWFTYYAGLTYGALTVSSGGGKVAGTEGNLRLMSKLNPEVLIGIPTFIYHLLLQAVADGVRCSNLKRIVLGGEKVSDGLRRKLRELAEDIGAHDVDVLATYGFTEAKLAWAECPFPHDQPSGGYHLYPDLGVIEIVDPKSNEPVGEGQPGEIVFTPLAARGSVVLRYRTGDFIDGGLFHERCPYCGRTVPRLVGRISRASEVREMNLDKLKGTLVDFNQLEHVLDDAPHVGAWQLELRKAHDDPHEVDEIVLHVQKSDATDERALATALNQRFFAHTEIHPNRIEFHDAETLRRLQGLGVLIKEQKIVDHRPRFETAPPTPPTTPPPSEPEDSHAFAK